MNRSRVNKEEVFRLVRYTPHAGQVAMHRSTARYRVLACGARFGKSLAAAMEVVAALLQPCEKSLGWIVAPTRDLADRILERVLMAFHEHLKHRIVEYEPRQQRLVVRNLGGGLSEVRGKSGDNAVSLLGESLDWLVVDEAAKLDRSIWENYLAARLVDRRGWALLLSTPTGTNWFWQLYRRGVRGRDPSHESWRSPSWDNPHIDPLAIEDERGRLPPAAFAQEFAAEFVGAEAEPCESCGCPNPEAKGAHIIETDADLLRCEACRNLVDPEGRTLIKLWPDGRAWSKVVVLRPASLEEPIPETAPVPLPIPDAIPELQPVTGDCDDFDLADLA